MIAVPTFHIIFYLINHEPNPHSHQNHGSMCNSSTPYTNCLIKIQNHKTLTEHIHVPE